MPLSSALRIFGVWSGSMALAESRPVDVCQLTIYGLNSGVFLSTLLHCLILTVAWFGALSRACLHAYLPRLLLVLLFCPPGYVHLYVAVFSPSPECGLSFTNRIRGRLELPVHVHTVWSSLDQYPNTDSTV